MKVGKMKDCIASSQQQHLIMHLYVEGTFVYSFKKT